MNLMVSFYQMNGFSAIEKRAASAARVKNVRYTTLHMETGRKKFDGEGNTRFLPGEESYKEAGWRTGPDAKTNNLRLKRFCRQASSRASEKQAAGRENELVHFPVCPPAFRCALRAQAARLCFSLRQKLLRRQMRVSLRSFLFQKKARNP
ncbi:MAG: hypothetical protein IJ214_04220, partial [Clostridia bacterium]|nr:hypothetical protein [Clostridia bacterium]